MAMRHPGGIDFGYVTTVHKSQGSEYDRVLFVEDYLQGTDMARLRYTALTRARHYLEYYR